MKRFRVTILEEAEEDLDAIRTYVAGEASGEVAERFIETLLGRTETLAAFPSRGSPRPDLGPGVRTLVHKRVVTIVFRVGDRAVDVVGFCYRGRDVAIAMLGRS